MSRSFAFLFLVLLLSSVPAVFAATVRPAELGLAELNLTSVDLKAQGCSSAGGVYPVVLNYVQKPDRHALNDRLRSFQLGFSGPVQSSLWCDKPDAILIRAKIASFQVFGVHADSAVSSSIKAFVSIQPARTSFSAGQNTMLSLKLSRNEAVLPEQLADLNRILALRFSNVRTVRLIPESSQGLQVSYVGKSRMVVRIRGAFSVRLDDASIFNVTIPASVSTSRGALDCGTVVSGRSNGCSLTYSPDAQIRFEPVLTAALDVDGDAAFLCRGGQCVTFQIKTSADGAYALMAGGSLLSVVPAGQMASAFGEVQPAVAAASRPVVPPRTTPAPQAAEDAIAAFIRGRFG